jgi:DNA processing protein
MLTPSVHLSYFPNLTRARTRRALAYFGTAQRVLEASRTDLLACGWDTATVQAYIAWRQSFDVVAAAQTLESFGIHTIDREDPEYPSQLLELFDPPLCLFIRGSLTQYTTSISVVGTRKMSTYGAHIIDTLIPKLVQAGVTIVSGLAYGVDSKAHSVTLASQGITHAVLGSGVDVRSIAPSAHISLATNIIDHGGSVLSEYPPGMQATRYTFPERNRIIAALSKATLIIEAGEKSGSLITAQCALDIGRDVCAIPHPIHTPHGIGPNTLIKQGAHVITSAEDILTLLEIDAEAPQRNRTQPTSAIEVSIYQLLQTEALHIDEIILRTPNPTKESIMSTITIMEMRGLLKHMGNMMYIAV